MLPFTGGAVPLNHLLGVTQGKLPDAVAGKHSSDLFDSLTLSYRLYTRVRPLVLNEFLNLEVIIGANGDCGKMGDAQHLLGTRQEHEMLSDRKSNLATDSGINFVENQGPNVIGLGYDGFDRQHNARKLSPRRNQTQWFGRFPLVCRDDELDLVYSMGIRTWVSLLRRGVASGRP